MNILLTNDDSHRSPLLGFIIKKLNTLGKLTLALPKHEQSWRGKSMSRFNPVRVEELTLHGASGFAVDGTPADCANLGIYHLASGKPNLVVSGINAGLNTGTGFILCSGTVGACFEANIAGVPAIAISQEFDSETRNEYALEYLLPKNVQDRLELQTESLLNRLFAKFLNHPELLARPITWNINLPFRTAKNCELRVCRLGQTTYGSFFSRGEYQYNHELAHVNAEYSSDSDSLALREGHVSITPLDIHSFGQVAPFAPVELKMIWG